MGFVVPQNVIKTDPHFSLSCTECHKGNSSALTKEAAHIKMNPRPSDDPVGTCGKCHESTAKTYQLSLHYTASGMKHGVSARFNTAEKNIFETKVFEASCRSCHASCGDCHVKSPVISGVNSGLIDGHKFVKKAEDKTCALCHGGRVWPEFTGDYGGTPDVHYRKGMTCSDCHTANLLHGDGNVYASRRDVINKPSCTSCHDITKIGKADTKDTHAQHADKASCSACHTASDYRQCSSCHLGEGASSSPALVLGMSPREPNKLTTLRLVPTVRDTFKPVGLSMSNFDSLPNLWDAVPHNVAKRTDRTRDCNTCHFNPKYYLNEDKLPANGSIKNLELIP